MVKGNGGLISRAAIFHFVIIFWLSRYAARFDGFFILCKLLIINVCKNKMKINMKKVKKKLCNRISRIIFVV